MLIEFYNLFSFFFVVVVVVVSKSSKSIKIYKHTILHIIILLICVYILKIITNTADCVPNHLKFTIVISIIEKERNFLNENFKT